MPKSRTRTRAVYTPPPRPSRSKVSPRWLAPAIVICLVVGLVWIALYYVTSGSLPISAMGSWNLVIPFGLFIAAVALATRWR
jgi:hypothetical protein